jgi:hypothetical protein
MSLFRLTLQGITGMIIFLAMIGCSSSGSSSVGVARVDVSQEIEVADTGSSEPELTDEEIATQFTQCMRDQGLNVPDPTLNADGAIDLSAMRESVFNDPETAQLGPSARRELFEECVPLLQGATFAQAPSQEDMVELQDDLLKLSQCLRENGFDVPDPDFSSSNRGAMMRSIFQGQSIDREEIDSCIQSTLGADNPGAGGRPGPGNPGTGGRPGPGNGGRGG